MRKIRSLTQLNDDIDSDLARRKRILTDLRLAVGKAKGSSRRTLSLAALCVLYGHWEGFIKFAGNCYVNYVHHQGLPLEKLSDSIVCIYLRAKIGGLRDSKNISLHRDFVSTMRNNSTEPLSLSSKSAIETYSNLNFEVLSEIICIVGCDGTYYETKKAQIDEKFLRHQNSISHSGDDLSFDECEYLELHSAVISLIEKFRDDVEDSALNRSFQLQEKQ